MSRKSTVLNSLTRIGIMVSDYSKGLGDIMHNDTLSAKGKDDQIAAATNNFMSRVASPAQAITDALQSAQNDIFEKVISNADILASVSFSNALRVLELCGKTMAAQDIQDTISPFTGSPVATNALRAALYKSGRVSGMEDAGLFPPDGRTQAMQQLKNWQGQVKTLIDPRNFSKVYEAALITKYFKDGLAAMNDDLTGFIPRQ